MQRSFHHAAILAVIIGALGAVSAEASEKWWLTPEIQRELRLTPGQIDHLSKIFDSTLAERVALRKALDRLEADLASAMHADDEKRAVQLIPEVEKARASRNTARTMLLVRMYRSLTPQQRRKLYSRLGPAGPLSEVR